MGSKNKVPPKLTDKTNYADWKYDITVWQKFTDLVKEKQGPALFLSLEGKALECARGVDIDALSGNDGFGKVVAALDALFLKDADTRAFLEFKEFYEYRRKPSSDVTDFVAHFEYLYNKVLKHNMTLPEGVKAFFLLKAANVSVDHEKLARATCSELKYETMKQNIIKIFGDFSLSGGSSNSTVASDEYDPMSSVIVKTEPTYIAQSSSFNENDVFYSENGRGRGYRNNYNHYNHRGGRGRSYQKNNQKCFKCGKSDHIRRFCPELRKRVEEVHITLFNSEDQTKMTALIRESLGCALLDSGCTKTVCGKLWLEEYLSDLGGEDLAKVKYRSDETAYRFGDGMPSVSNQTVELPAVVGGQQVTIKAGIVSNSIPLLLSKEAMATAGVLLDFANGRAKILNEWCNLKTSVTGHFLINLGKSVKYSSENVVLHLESIQNASEDVLDKKALKLHRTLGHCSKDKMLALVKKSKSHNDKRFIQAIKKCCDSCSVCVRYKKPPLRPIVTTPLATEFNEVVCMDLKLIDSKYMILHLIDSATRYSMASIVRSKKATEIVHIVSEMWIKYFGAPGTFMSDNGGEFSNELFEELCGSLNIIDAKTAPYSGFSNGTVERHNGVLAETVSKLLNDPELNCTPSLAVSWGVSAKNSLLNHNGFTPNQLVQGKNVSLPSVVIDKLPALQGTTSDFMRRKLQIMNRAKEAYLQAESSEKVKRALRLKVRTHSDTVYRQGDKVYYIKPPGRRWKGPAVVMGQTGSKVLIHHGGGSYHVHSCHLMKVSDAEPSRYDENSPAVVEVNSEIEDIHGSDTDEENEVSHTLPQSSTLPVDVADNQSNTITELPKRNSWLRFKLDGSNEWSNAKTHMRQPKQSGKYNNWVNVTDTDKNEDLCINWDTVVAWEPTEDPTNVQSDVFVAVDSGRANEIGMAKEKELANLRENDVFQVVPNSGQLTVSSRWVITEKMKNGNRTIKARLVARGFEENSSNLQVDSPTCAKESLRLLFVLCGSLSWRIHSIDISSAFLQGGKLERELFLKPPKDACTADFVWLLKRCIYGLNDAPRSWYNKVKDVLISLGACIYLCMIIVYFSGMMLVECFME